LRGSRLSGLGGGWEEDLAKAQIAEEPDLF